eukprot:CAMPEP_0180789212 /NCGR_PEP_ID=MMETSP1038_2-20121128/52479_1 /TAXON_ID=632150 /ORGANISM="Azadinium spinosum, Strain 3D9" /LENGTH=114 /DNA_ID=CAMNT_0022826917 /DNA_START=239 /DNA_END=583 /DNA_ORIENTATION=+
MPCRVFDVETKKVLEEALALHHEVANVLRQHACEVDSARSTDDTRNKGADYIGSERAGLRQLHDLRVRDAEVLAKGIKHDVLHQLIAVMRFPLSEEWNYLAEAWPHEHKLKMPL